MKQNDYLEKLFETQIVLSSDVAGAHTPCLNGREALHRANAAFEGDGGGGEALLSGALNSATQVTVVFMPFNSSCLRKYENMVSTLHSSCDW